MYLLQKLFIINFFLFIVTLIKTCIPNTPATITYFFLLYLMTSKQQFNKKNLFLINKTVNV